MTSRLHQVLLAALVLVVVGWALDHVRLRATADIHASERQAASDSLALVVEAMDREAAATAARDTATARRVRELEDSVARARAARQAERRRLEEVARAAAHVGDSLAATIVEAVPLDLPIVRAAVAAAVREREAHVQLERDAHAAQLVSVDAQLQEERSLREVEREVLAEQREQLRVELRATQAAFRAQGEVVRHAEAEIAALRRTPGSGIGRSVKAVAGAGVGALLGATLAGEKGAAAGGMLGAGAGLAW